MPSLPDHALAPHGPRPCPRPNTPTDGPYSALPQGSHPRCRPGGSRAAGAGGRGEEEGAPELGKAAGRREVESAAARREGELRRRILHGRTRRWGRDAAAPLSSVWGAAAGLNCSHPNRAQLQSPESLLLHAAQIEAGRLPRAPLPTGLETRRLPRAPPPPGSGMADRRRPWSLRRRAQELPPSPRRRKERRRRGGSSSPATARREERHCAAPEQLSRRSATSPPPPFDPRGAMAPPLPNGASSGGVSIDGERWRHADAREAGLRRGGMSIFPSEGRLEQEEPPLPLPLCLNGPQTPSYGVVDASVTARSASWQLLP
ncbi:unnamed protein product [Urochloa humidicola]